MNSKMNNDMNVKMFARARLWHQISDGIYDKLNTSIDVHNYILKNVWRRCNAYNFINYKALCSFNLLVLDL